MNLFNILSIFAMVVSFAVHANPLLKTVDKDGFFAVRSIDGDGKTINGVYYSIHHFAQQAAQEACEAALSKCQTVTGEGCQVVYQKDTLGQTGVLWAPADFLCVAKSQTSIAKAQAHVQESRWYDHVLKHWHEFKYHATRFFDPMYQAGSANPYPDDGK